MAEALADLRSLGTYEIVRKLGAGGMAEVFLAIQRMAGNVERLVVVKSILPALAADDRFKQMFLREARIAAMLTHSNIVHIHDVPVIDDRPCIVMEFLRGRDLAFLLKRLAQRGDAVEPRVAAAIVAQAASGLDYAHRKTDERGRVLHLVHRDVSPHNLFVTREGDVRVLDFGIAKTAREREHTEAGTLKGKLAYMAPEYLRGEAVDGRADEFALGVVLWEALTGRRLFSRKEHFQTMEALFSLKVDPPSSVVPGVPPELDAIALRALSRTPSERFPTCEDMADALRATLRTAGAPGEGALLSQWLAALVPVAEDQELYGGNPSGMTTTFARPTTDPSSSGLLTTRATAPSDRPEAPTHELKRAAPAGTKTVAPPDFDVSQAQTAQLVGTDLGSTETVARPSRPDPTVRPVTAEASPRRRAGPLVAVGVGIVLLGAAAVVGLIATADHATTSTPLAPVAPAPPTDVEVRFQNVPEGARVEVDGVPVAGTRLRTRPSFASRHVRVLRGAEQLVAMDEVFDQTMVVAIPTLAAPPSVAAPAAPPARAPGHATRRGGHGTATRAPGTPPITGILGIDE